MIRQGQESDQGFMQMDLDFNNLSVENAALKTKLAAAEQRLAEME
jgi:hypothetical protein